MTALPPTAQPPAAKATSAPAAPEGPKALKAVPFPPEPIKAACDELVARYPTRMAALLPVLHLAQKQFGGWISPEVEAGVAEYLGLPDAHVRGVLTFYAMFHTKPVGRHEVWVCRTLTCWLLGAKDLTRKALEKTGVPEVGGTDPKGRFTVKEMECLGLCEVAPAVFVDGAPHVHVTPERLEALLEACP